MPILNRYAQVKGGLYQYKKEHEELRCPICGKVVDFLVGEDEQGQNPNRGRRGCEQCYRPTLVESKDSGPGDQVDLLSGVSHPGADDAPDLQSLISEAR